MALQCKIPEDNVLGILQPRHAEAAGTSGEIMKKALSNPIGTPVIKEIVKPGEKVAVITSDLTRPCPSQEVLPPVLEELREAGISDENITIIFALGSHRAHTEEEMRHLVGDSIFEQFKCIDHDPSDCISLGSTSAGTPVEIFRPVVEADRRVCVGNIEFHYFAGYSGGAKASLVDQIPVSGGVSPSGKTLMISPYISCISSWPPPPYIQTRRSLVSVTPPGRV